MKDLDAIEARAYAARDILATGLTREVMDLAWRHESVRAPRGKAIVPDERFMDVVKHEDRVAWAVSDRNDDAISGLAGAARDVGRRLHTVLADAASRWRCPVYMEETCYLHSEEGGGVETLMFTFTLRRGRFSRRKDLLSIGERFRRAITAAFRRRLG